MTLPRQERIEIWERGTCRFAAERPYAALLITRHALNLFSGRRGEEEWAPFLDFLDDFEASLLEETGAGREEVEADYPLIDLADLISLTACTRRSEPVERYGVRIVPTHGGRHRRHRSLSFRRGDHLPRPLPARPRARVPRRRGFRRRARRRPLGRDDRADPQGSQPGASPGS